MEFDVIGASSNVEAITQKLATEVKGGCDYKFESITMKCASTLLVNGKDPNSDKQHDNMHIIKIVVPIVVIVVFIALNVIIVFFCKYYKSPKGN